MSHWVLYFSLWSLGSRLVTNICLLNQWGLLGGALVFAAPVIWLKIKDTVSIEEDLKFSDETVADVVAPEKNTVDFKTESAV